MSTVISFIGGLVIGACYSIPARKVYSGWQYWLGGAVLLFGIALVCLGGSL